MERIKDHFSDLYKKSCMSYFDFMRILNSRGFSEDELALVLKAFHRASDLHSGQRRKSGEAYITHPVSVACILMEHGFDCETICASLIHDTVEDTNYTLMDVEKDFGKTIAYLVDGVTKMKSTDFTSKEEQKIATHRKIIDKISNDARIITIKLADRLHNMITLEALPDEKISEISMETMNFYVPIARFLGIYQIKDELQDLGLFYLDQENYLRWSDYRNGLKQKHLTECNVIGEEVRRLLNNTGISLEFNCKIKNVAGIFNEVSQGKKLDDINDLIAVRMIVEKVLECYKTLDIVKDVCRYVEGTFVDYIKTPKYNGYQTLLASVITGSETSIQTRIRTSKMDKTNRLGVVSNWNPIVQQIVRKRCVDLVGTDISYIDSSYDGRTKRIGGLN